MLKVEVIGNLGADAEVKTSNGSQFVAFRIADSSKYKDQQGKEVNVTNWIDCVMSNAESKVIPYLKAGVKVFVRGNGSLRVYSSKKDRMMKAGLQVSVVEVELCGGNNDAVPRQVIDPADGTIHDVKKYYLTDVPTKGMKKEDLKELIDARGNQFLMDNRGWVTPVQPAQEPAEEETQAKSEEQ